MHDLCLLLYLSRKVDDHCMPASTRSSARLLRAAHGCVPEWRKACVYPLTFNYASSDTIIRETTESSSGRVSEWRAA